MAVFRFLSSSVQDGGSYVAFLAANEADLVVTNTRKIAVTGDTAIIPGNIGANSTTGAGFMAFDLVNGTVKALIRSGVTTGASSDLGSLAHVNSAGEILIYGSIFSTNNRQAILRYSAGFQLLEHKIQSLTSTNVLNQYSLSVDDADAAYVLGSWTSTATSVRKFTTLTPLTNTWAVTVPYPGAFATLGSDGFLYVAVRDTSTVPNPIVLIRMDASTGAVAAQTAFQAADNLGAVFAIEKDGLGNLYIAHSTGLIKVSESALAPIWSITLTGLSPRAMHISSGGKVNLAGSTGQIAQVSADGSIVYARKLYDPAGNIPGVNFYAMFEHSDALYVVGRLTGSAYLSQTNAMIAKLPGYGQLTGTYGPLSFNTEVVTSVDNPLSVLASAVALTSLATATSALALTTSLPRSLYEIS